MAISGRAVRWLGLATILALIVTVAFARRWCPGGATPGGADLAVTITPVPANVDCSKPENCYHLVCYDVPACQSAPSPGGCAVGEVMDIKTQKCRPCSADDCDGLPAYCCGAAVCKNHVECDMYLCARLAPSCHGKTSATCGFHDLDGDDAFGDCDEAPSDPCCYCKVAIGCYNSPCGECTYVDNNVCTPCTANDCAHPTCMGLNGCPSGCPTGQYFDGLRCHDCASTSAAASIGACNPGVNMCQNKPRVRVRVDTNRDGVVDDKDDPGKDQAVVFKADQGALVLVNCDWDGVPLNPDAGVDVHLDARDLDDFVISSAEDEKDLSPITIELLDDLAPGENLWIVIENDDPADKNQDVFLHILDTASTSQTDMRLVGKDLKERQLDGYDCNGTAPGTFSDRKARAYAGRFLLEGLRFSKGVKIRLEIRNAGGKVNSDEVEVLDCPWIVNNNTQPLSSRMPDGVNLFNSGSFAFKKAHGASLLGGLGGKEFVQDAVEWGFQVRRQKPANTSRTLISGLRLDVPQPALGDWPRHFLSGDVGLYGWFPNDEPYYTAGNSADAGGNLEALPPDATDRSDLFGTIVHGSNMTKVLTDFLDRQAAQRRLALPITPLGLVHVDEVIMVAPKLGGGFVVIMPDWVAAKALLQTAPGIQHNIPVEDNAGNALPKYRDISNFLGGAGRQVPDASYSAALAAIKAALPKGLDIPSLPAMYFKIWAPPGPRGAQHAFPRNIANCQPTVAGTLIVSEPPQQGAGAGLKANLFFDAWTATLKNKNITVEGEDMRFAYGNGGEVHCSSNTVREPIQH